VTAPSLDPRLLLESPVFEGACLLLGLVVGSFANVCIHRLPRGQSVVAPPSRCPSCGALIAPFDNVPVLGWLWLKGRCRSCGAPISPRYPAVELLNGLLYLGLAFVYGPGVGLLVAMALGTALVVLALIDLDHQILPDVITLPGIAAGLVASLLPGARLSLVQAALAAAAGYLMMMGVGKLADWYYGEHALGQGDWKMVAMLGAFLGWRGMLLAVFLGTFLGAAFGLAMVALGRGSRRTKLPLGTFLAAGGLAVLLAGERVLRWYGSFYGV
jgi:leader peptidase (prepilin peptidase)/N-methyltransferase